jgi:flagellar biosynthesis protein FlhG
VADFRIDQAAGLRRLFQHRRLRVISFASGSPGVGKTAVVANVAVSLARQGQEVLVVDENGGGNHMGRFFGMHADGDLLQVLDRKRSLEQVVFSPMAGLHILPAGGAARRLGQLSPAQQAAMQASMQQLFPAIDTILVDTSPAHAHGFSPWGLAAGEAVMVVSGSGNSITDAYALIKKVSLAFTRRRFRILVNRVRAASEGQVIFGNLRRVAAERGIAELEYGGAVPLDERLHKAALLCQPIVTTLPDAPAALALRDFAAALLAWPGAEYEKGGVDQFIRQLLNLSHQITPRALRA